MELRTEERGRLLKLPNYAAPRSGKGKLIRKWHAVSVDVQARHANISAPAWANFTTSVSTLAAKIHGAQDDPPRSALKLLGEEFARCDFLDPVTQPQELLVTLIGFCLHATFKFVHRRTATAQEISVSPFIIENSMTIRLCSKPLTFPRSSGIFLPSFSTAPLFARWRIDFGDFAKTVGFGVMRTGHEGPADRC